VPAAPIYVWGASRATGPSTFERPSPGGASHPRGPLSKKNRKRSGTPIRFLIPWVG